MDISISPELESFIAAKLESGRYRTPDEVIEEGLRLLKQSESLVQDEMTDVREKVSAGLKQARSGDLRDGEEVLSEIEAELMKRSGAT